MRSSSVALILSVACFVVGGCYSYVPIETAPPGTDIRARLTADAAVRRSQGLDEPILQYHGMVVASTPDSLMLDMLIARNSSVFQQIEIRDTMSLARSEIQSLMGRRLSLTKSLLVTVATGAAAFGIIKGIDQIVGGTGDDEDGGTPTARVPVFRWVDTRLETIFGRIR
jgi:hypothetical protein